MDFISDSGVKFKICQYGTFANPIRYFRDNSGTCLEHWKPPNERHSWKVSSIFSRFFGGFFRHQGPPNQESRMNVEEQSRMKERAKSRQVRNMLKCLKMIISKTTLVPTSHKSFSRSFQKTKIKRKTENEWNSSKRITVESLPGGTTS